MRKLFDVPFDVLLDSGDSLWELDAQLVRRRRLSVVTAPGPSARASGDPFDDDADDFGDEEDEDDEDDEVDDEDEEDEDDYA